MDKYDFTLLYVEDDEYEREEMEIYFKSLSDNIFSAKNGKEGLELYEKLVEECDKKIDLLITDIKMPELNGIDMVKRICKKYPQSVIFLSAFSEDNLIIESINAAKGNLIKYLNKPIEFEKFEDLLKNYYSKKE